MPFNFSFSTFLKEISGYFDRRFLLSQLFPVLIFTFFNLVMSFALWGPQTLIEHWRTLPAELQILIAVGGVGLLVFFSYSLDLSLIRLYEGYWDSLPVLNWWEKVRRSFYQQRWDFLNGEVEHLAAEIAVLESNIPKNETVLQRQERKRRADELRNVLGVIEREWFLFLPPKREHVVPTQFGNILRASELYSLRRYNLDAVVAWPRMQSLLPKEFAEGLRDAKAKLDLLLVVTTLGWVFALGWEIGLGVLTNRWDLFLIASLGWLLALISYSGVLQAARSYGELIKASFDLYRWELLKALHLKMPDSYENERKLWDEVNGLLYRNYPPAPEVFRYETESAKPTIPHQGGFIQSAVGALMRLFGLGDEPGAKK